MQLYFFYWPVYFLEQISKNFMVFQFFWPIFTPVLDGDKYLLTVILFEGFYIAVLLSYRCYNIPWKSGDCATISLWSTEYSEQTNWGSLQISYCTNKISLAIEWSTITYQQLIFRKQTQNFMKITPFISKAAIFTLEQFEQYLHTITVVDAPQTTFSGWQTL